MSEPTLRRRRQRRDSTDTDVFLDRKIDTPPPVQEPVQYIEPLPNNAPVEPETTTPDSTTSKLTVVDRIRDTK